MALQLSEVDARSRLEQMLQADQEPTLTAGEVIDLLNLARRADTSGVAPSQTGWVPSWDLNAAAAEGWRRKAGKVGGRFDVSMDGATLHRAQMFGNCLKMAEQYARRVASSVPLAGYKSEANQVANL